MTMFRRGDYGLKKERITAMVSQSLRSDLLAACERSGRSLTEEVEARLRQSLDTKAADNIILVRMDSGLFSYFQALANSSVAIFGDIEDTIIFAARTWMIDHFNSDGFAFPMMKHPPESVQKAWSETPRFQSYFQGKR